MRKLFSIFAAMLVAVAVFADPIVLPATLDVNNVSFRSEGMPDFMLAEGDYAGTYFDMGAHDSSNDTLLYAEWNVTIQPLKYNITVGVYNENSWSVRFHVLNQANEEVKTMYYKGHSGEKGKYAAGTIDMRDLAAGDYKIRVHAATAWSKLKVKEVIMEADYQGVTVALPGTLLPAYAELSANASVTDGAIAFKPSTAPDEYATWNVSFAAAGNYNVAINMTASNGHNYGVALLSADGTTEIGAVNEGGQVGDTGEKELGAIAVPAAGNYIVKLTNAIKWSEAVLNSITFAAPAQPKTIYFNSGAWATELGRFAIYCITGESWADLVVESNETNLYKAEIPGNVEQVVFCRMNPELPANEWASVWNQTEDLTIPEGKDLYTITGWGEGYGAKATGEWSKYGVAPEPLDAPDAAPADPTYPAYQVKAVYSAKYNADCNFGEWGSGTQYAQEEYGKKYITGSGDKGYFGLEFADLNCSNMENLHLDAWIAADASIRIVPIIRGSGEIGVTVNLQGQKWNSIDIPLAEFAGVTNWNAVYQIKIDQAADLTFWLNNVYFYTTVAPVVDLKDGYYLIGLNGWTEYDLTAADLFTQNPGNTKEFILEGVTLKAGQEFKVVAVANNALGAWYPGEAGNYQVDLGHAGENKSIYFRPDYSGGDDWHAKCIYVPGIDLGPIVKTSFATYGWGEDKESYVTWDEASKTVTVNLVKGKDAQWQAQIWYQGPIAQAGKLYDISVTFNSTKAIGGVTLKYENNVEMIYDQNIALEANTPLVYEKKDIEGKDNGDGILVFDFGYAPENTVVTISNISIVEKDPEGIINTNAAVKTVKMIENGQVVIIKNGVRYNVLGTVIR